MFYGHFFCLLMVAGTWIKLKLNWRSPIRWRSQRFTAALLLIGVQNVYGMASQSNSSIHIKSKTCRNNGILEEWNNDSFL
jgi:hypothetical protein